jgi:trimethylamine--corrinoid protein Co-methyltransferase
VPDAQAAHEKTITAMLTAQGGANIIYGAGMLDLGMTFDFAQLLIDAEIFKMVLHTVNWFDVNENTLCVDLIKKIGVGGEFVSDAHTTSNYKSIQSNSDLINRSARDAWAAEGGKDMTAAAYEKAARILETHEPAPLEPDQAKFIEDTVATAAAK